MLRLKIPPPVYMLFTGSVMWLLDHYFPLLTIIPSPWNLLGLVLIVVALLTDGASLLQFIRAHTTINPLHPEKTKHLVTTGPYSYTRNPMYLGLLILLAGWGIWLGSLTPFFMLPVFAWLLTSQQIIPEERILEQKFGQAYRDYKSRVRRWF